MARELKKCRTKVFKTWKIKCWKKEDYFSFLKEKLKISFINTWRSRNFSEKKKKNSQNVTHTTDKPIPPPLPFYKRILKFFWMVLKGNAYINWSKERKTLGTRNNKKKKFFFVEKLIKKRKKEKPTKQTIKMKKKEEKRKLYRL